MGIGLGVVLLLLGLILAFDVVNLPASIDNNLDSNTLGWILIIVGILALVLAVVVNSQRTRRSTVVEERRIDDGRL
jgi:membrane-bound ClpP family serine protease